MEIWIKKYPSQAMRCNRGTGEKRPTFSGYPNYKARGKIELPERYGPYHWPYGREKGNVDNGWLHEKKPHPHAAAWSKLRISCEEMERRIEAAVRTLGIVRRDPGYGYLCDVLLESCLRYNCGRKVDMDQLLDMISEAYGIGSIVLTRCIWDAVYTGRNALHRPNARSNQYFSYAIKDIHVLIYKFSCRLLDSWCDENADSATSKQV